MLINDVSAAALASPAHQQSAQRTEQSEVQQASVSSTSRVAVEVAPTAVKAAGQLDTPQDKAKQAKKGNGEEDSQSGKGDPKEDIRKKLEELGGEVLGDANTKVSIQIDKDTNRFIYQTRDANSGEVIKQYPTEEFLSQVGRMRDVRGLAVEKEV